MKKERAIYLVGNVRCVYAVPFAVYEQFIFFYGKRHGANSIIFFEQT